MKCDRQVRDSPSFRFFNLAKHGYVFAVCVEFKIVSFSVMTLYVTLVKVNPGLPALQQLQSPLAKNVPRAIGAGG